MVGCSIRLQITISPIAPLLNIIFEQILHRKLGDSLYFLCIATYYLLKYTLYHLPAQVTQNELVLVVKENEYILLDTQSRGSASLPARPEWHLDRIDQQALPLDHKYTASQYTGKSVDVYVLDTGIHYNHSVFNGRAHYPGCDPIDKLENETREGEDCNGHGTHVAGLVGGNGTGLATSVTLFSVRVANCRGRASEASLLDGLMCVLKHRKSRNGTRAVVNISLAGIANFSTLSDAVWKILENNIPIIASAGNGRHQTANFDACKLAPAGYRGVITVGATDMDDNAVFGEYDNNAITLNFNLGSCVNVFAPGYNILSSDICTVNIPCYKPNSDSSKTALDDDLGVGCGKTCQKFRSGTSQSTAIVSGAVALLLEKCPTLQHKQIPHIVSTSLSKGRVRFCKAFEFISHFRQLLAVNDVVGSSPNRLLNIGEFPSFNCTIKS